MRASSGRSPSEGTEPTSATGDAIRARLEERLDAGAGAVGGVAPAIADHTLLHRIGTGAYGEVWLARNALGTLRAVKIVYRAHFEEERPYQREFHGILKYEPISRSHEGLVGVLHVGRNDDAGCFYYVMELADNANVPEARSRRAAGPDSSRPGSNPNQVARPDAAPPPASSQAGPERPAATAYTPRTLHFDLARHQRLPPVEAARLAARLAGALAHLHTHGLVHRDIKPSNVIFVGGRPKLADIGLVTGAGDSRSFVGTEGFIPPEGPGTARADVYGLGKLLYEAATGQDRLEFPQLPLRLENPADAEALLELNEVITRACAPEPAKRYASATELEADLNLFLAGRSLRQARKVERHVVWLRRFALAACGVLALALAAIWFAHQEARSARLRAQLSQERARTESALRQRAEAAEREQSRLREEAQVARLNEAQLRRKAEAQELAARKKAYASDMNLLQSALAADDLGRAQELLERQRPQPGEIDLRGWEWRYFWQFCQSDAAFTLCQRSNSITALSYSSDGSLLAVGTWGEEVTVWEPATRRMIYQKQATPGLSARLAFAPRGSLLAFYDSSNNVPELVLWDGQTRSEVKRFKLGGSLRDLDFASDGRLFTADFSRSNNVIAWDLASGGKTKEYTLRIPGYAMGTIFNITRDGRRFVHALGNRVNSVRVTQADGSGNATFRVADELTTALAFAPDGELLATGAGYSESAIKLWEVGSQQLLGSLEGHRSWVSCLKFLADGRTLASASADRTVRLWDSKTRQPLRTLRGHLSELWTLDVSPDGRWLASGCKDGSVLIWDLSSSTNRPPPYRTLQPGVIGQWCYSPDGRWIAANQPNGLGLFDAATLQPINESPLPLTNILGLAFSPDLKLLAATDAKGSLLIWDIPDRTLVTNISAHSAPAYLFDTVFFSGGKTLLTFDSTGLTKEWETTSWNELRHWSITANNPANAYCETAHLLATATGDGLFELLTLTNPQPRRQFMGQNRIVSLDLSPDGSTLAAASENGTVELWDTETLTRRALLRGALLGYHTVAISPDGARVAAGSNGQEAMKIWDLASYEEVATLQGQGSFFSDAGFSADANTIGARNWNGVIHFWHAPSWQEIEAVERRRAASGL